MKGLIDNMNQVKCISCDNIFILTNELIQTKYIDNIDVKYFKCKDCNEIYIISCVDKYVLNRQLEYKKLVRDKAKLIQDTVKNRHLHITKYDKKIKAIDANKLSVLEDMKRHSDVIAAKVKDKL